MSESHLESYLLNFFSMIHLEKWQSVPDNENLEVFEWGDFEPEDFVLCNNKGEDFAIVQFQANFFQ